MWLAKLALVLAATYAIIVAVVYATQTRMLFPTGLATAPGLVLPASAVRLEVETADGERLQGMRIPPVQHPAGEQLVVLAFGGNAWNAGSLAAYLHGLFPDAEVVATIAATRRVPAGRALPLCLPMHRLSMTMSWRALARGASSPSGSALAPASRLISRPAGRLPA